MKQPDFDPFKSVILEENPAGFVPQEGVRVVSVDFYQPNQVVMTVESAKPRIMVFSDNHYPAWQAFVDGAPAKIYRADYTFRAVILPAGRHKVEFKYYSKIFNTGRTISIISALLVILGIIGLSITGRTGGKGTEQEKKTL